MVWKTRAILLLGWLTMVAILLAGCSLTKSTLSYEEFEQRSQRWLQGIPCRAPCWEGITPGQTTVREAMSLLGQNPMIKPDSVQVKRDLCGDGPEEIPGSRRLAWDWILASDPSEGGAAQYEPVVHSQPEPQPTCGLDVITMHPISLDAATADSIITRIQLYFRVPVPDPDPSHHWRYYTVTLGDVVRAYGEPDYIVAVKEPEHSWYAVNLIYEPEGFVLMTVSRSELVLSDELGFEGMVHSSPEIG